MDVPAVMQRKKEVSRVVVDGTRTDDGDLCTLIAVQQVGGAWKLYPHGAGQFGVHLPAAAALKVAQAILAGSR